MSLDITDNNHWIMLVDILVQSIFFYDIYCEIELCGFVAVLQKIMYLYYFGL